MPPKSKKEQKEAERIKKAAAIAAKDLEKGDDDEIVPFHKVEKKKEMSRAQKEWLFIVKKIETRLKHLLPEAKYDVTKGCCGVIGFLFLVAGGVIVLKATSQTVLFASDPFSFELLIVGGSFGLPCIIWFIYIFIWPHLCCKHCRNIKASRTFIHEQRKDRKDPGLFNAMVAAANKDSEPPIIRTRLFAMFRKHEHTIVCHTMQEFQEIFHFRTGVQPDRQLIKLREQGGSSYVFDFKPEEFIIDLAERGIVKDTLFWVYAKGGFENDVIKSPDKRMVIVRKGNEDIDKIIRQCTKEYSKSGPPKKDALETELDDIMEKELEAEVEKERLEKIRLEEEAEEEARFEAEEAEKGGILGWLSPFKKKVEVPVEDPHDDIYRGEMEIQRQKLYLKLNPPEEIVEEEKFAGFGPPQQGGKR